MVFTVVSYYTIVRYFPDPINGECINIGVLAYGAHGPVIGQFIEDLSRCQAVSPSGEDLSWLRGTIRRFRRDIKTWSRHDVERMREWANAIQIGPPCASILSPEETLARMVPHLLVSPEIGDPESPQTGSRSIMLGPPAAGGTASGSEESQRETSGG